MKIRLTEKDFDFDWFSGTGAGGQHRNKHQNCLRLTHKESGITVTASKHRERSLNKKEAFSNILPKMAGYYQKEPLPDRNDRIIRSYFLEDGRVVDHMLDEKFTMVTLDDFDLDSVLNRKLHVLRSNEENEHQRNID